MFCTRRLCCLIFSSPLREERGSGRVLSAMAAAVVSELEVLFACSLDESADEVWLSNEVGGGVKLCSLLFVLLGWKGGSQDNCILLYPALHTAYTVRIYTCIYTHVHVHVYFQARLNACRM